MLTLLSADLIDGMTVVGVVAVATTLLCPILFWALTTPLGQKA
ncbi:MAG: hypothetical protein AAF289_16285 [Cyanobacteria bacterium P01_A01_bin.135]